MKAELEKAAAARRSTLSDEIQMRLRRTFIEDEKMADAFGDRRTYLLMRLVALTLQTGWNPANPGPSSWLDDPVAFDQARETLRILLDGIRPKDLEPNSPNEDWDLYLKAKPMGTAAAIWNGIQNADPSLPLNDGTRKQHLAGIIKAELGEVANRPGSFEGTAEELRAAADQLEAFERDQPTTRTKRTKKNAR
ncbi:hypothetical protein NKH53_13740 [Mesorhizobium australicum]|uniref:hypothetical protein n=1 Tax=Mesorhizobium australicum TaxID=536018 RepID=UPI0033381EFF